MIIFKDMLTGEEVCSDAFNVKYECDDSIIAIAGKTVTRKVGETISDAMIGGNPSAEDGEDEQLDDSVGVVSGIDVVLDFKLEDQSDFFNSKKALQSYVKKWVVNVSKSEYLAEEPKKCEEFKKQCKEHIKDFLDKWSEDASVYTAPNFDPGEHKSGLFIGVWSESGMEIVLYGLKGSLIEEKC